MKNITHSDDRYFKTSNFYTAVYLYAKDCELINIDKTADPKRVQFVFINNPEVEILVNIFNFAKDNDPDLQVNSRSFITAIKNLKTLLYQQDE
jgi:hypothetical protein